MKNLGTSAVRGAAITAATFLLFGPPGFRLQSQAQEANPPATATAATDTTTAVRDLQEQVRELRALVEQMRGEDLQSRAEMHQLRQDLQATRALLEHPNTPGQAGTGETVAESGAGNQPQTTENVASNAAPIEERVQHLEDTTSLIASKIDEQYQTKVETASKYRARLHGIVLMNAFRNVGGTENLDFPTYAMPVGSGSPQAALGATLRQSEIGLEIFGPKIAGARTSADVQLDFAGGFPTTGNGVNFGIARLQTASVRFDWDQTSVVAGQDSLFISPLSPTSFASLATPTFAFAGNLWAWTPQIRVEHRFPITGQQTITVQAGLLDNLDWEPNYNSFLRTPQAGESSGQPAYALRTAWSRPVNGRPLGFGVAGYYGQQNWSWSRYVDAYAGMADWQIPILPRLALSGEFYRGRGIGGLGGAIGTSIVYGGRPTYAFSPIRGVDTAGGWAQLKLQIAPKVEVNGAVSDDDAFTRNIRGFATDLNNGGSPGSILGRNRAALANVVFRPRSDLVLSAELRRLRTFPVYTSSTVTNQASLAVGILF